MQSLIGAEHFERISNALYKSSSGLACGTVAGFAISMSALDLLRSATSLYVWPSVAVAGVQLLWYGANFALGRIDEWEFAGLAGRTVAESSVLICATVDGAKLGAAVGTAALPGVGTAVGMVAGIIIGALAGWGTRKLIDYICPSEEQRKRNARMKAMREALAYFHFSPKQCRDPTQFNKKKIQRRFRRYALECHPDTNKGNNQKWLELSTHYGILMAMIENRMFEDKKLMREICK